MRTILCQFLFLFLMIPNAAFSFDAERVMAYHSYIILPLVVMFLPICVLVVCCVRLPGKKGRKGL